MPSQVAFHDVAASFTDEQWMGLETSKKDLYQNAVKEIHEALIALGYTIANPDILFKITKGDKSGFRVDFSAAERENTVADTPDLLLRVKEEADGETVSSGDKPASKGSEDLKSPTLAECPVIASVVSLNVKEEEDVCKEVAPDSEVKPANTDVREDSLSFIKQEEEFYSIDNYNSVGMESIVIVSSSPLSAIKQEIDPGDDRIQQEETGDLCNIIPVVIKQEDVDRTEEIQATRHNSSGGIARLRRSKQKSSIAKKTTAFKKQKVFSHAARIQLDEKTMRRLQVLKGMARPFRTLPCFMNDPIIKGQQPPGRSSDLKEEPQSAGPPVWCQCGKCCVFEDETLCCRSIPSLQSLLKEDCVCITGHHFFNQMCLGQDWLDFLFRFLGRTSKKEEALCYLHKLRRTAYRVFTVWAHDYLDYRKYKPIPACVVKAVRDSLPYPEELNVGIMKMYDYPAAIMALD